MILYTGIGCHPSGRHSEQDFLRRIRQEFYPLGGPYRPDQLDFENTMLPRDFATFTLEQWMRFSGASFEKESQ